MRSLEDANVSGKRVLLRLDLDTPLYQGKVIDTFRIKSALPTIHFLLNRRAKVVICGHLGRPNGKVVKELSLKPVIQELSDLLNQRIIFASDLFSESTKTAVEELSDGQILALENLRFDAAEEANSRTFAKKLAHYGEVFVNESFATCHREASSLIAITEFLPSFAGLLLEREVGVLTELLSRPARPFVVIMGGAKIADKLPTISSLANHADKILIGGGIANTFLAATGIDVKKSLVQEDQFGNAANIFKRYKDKIILPTDYIWHEDKILDIGAETVGRFEKEIRGAKTIFWNGPVGYSEDEQFAIGSVKIAQVIADTDATTIIGGGNTIEIIAKHDLIREMSFVSTGGGAALELLAGKQLPAVKVLD
ncbi:phosphoglycerate kinase [Candidatus Berkelbacteria bacterium]|nr:phosphoglycerate kinase [Candidatus Berkelbacteria bacterium]